MPVLGSDAAVHDCIVCDRREPSPGIVVIGVRAPRLAPYVRPGQFVMAILPNGERVATALGVYETADDRLSLMLVVVGSRTRELASLEIDAPLALLGPLGNGFDPATLGRNVALVAGGVGVAPLLLLARYLRACGKRVTLYYGAREAAALVDSELFSELGVEVVFATDDGSRGHHGHVTELLERGGSAHDGIAACGPTPMLRSVARVADSLGVRAQLSLEETFACGVGACWGCVVPLDRSSLQAPPFPPFAAGEGRAYVHARICKEGPVFWAHELRW
jgi:dihydroorotate dehydrogenase electron transfer subunit